MLNPRSVEDIEFMQFKNASKSIDQDKLIEIMFRKIQDMNLKLEALGMMIMNLERKDLKKEKRGPIDDLIKEGFNEKTAKKIIQGLKDDNYPYNKRRRNSISKEESVNENLKTSLTMSGFIANEETKMNKKPSKKRGRPRIHKKNQSKSDFNKSICVLSKSQRELPENKPHKWGKKESEDNQFQDKNFTSLNKIPEKRNNRHRILHNASVEAKQEMNLHVNGTESLHFFDQNAINNSNISFREQNSPYMTHIKKTKTLKKGKTKLVKLKEKNMKKRKIKSKRMEKSYAEQKIYPNFEDFENQNYVLQSNLKVEKSVISVFIDDGEQINSKQTKRVHDFSTIKLQPNNYNNLNHVGNKPSSLGVTFPNSIEANDNLESTKIVLKLPIEEAIVAPVIVQNKNKIKVEPSILEDKVIEVNEIKLEIEKINRCLFYSIGLKITKY